MDTKFSVALHILAYISETSRQVSSEALAQSVGTNASYIRKVVALLKRADLIVSHQGKTGYQLARLPEEISLLDIYRATQEVEQIKLFHTHQQPNQACPVGKHIEQAISPLFAKVERQLELELAHQTLAQVIANLYQSAGQEPI